MVFLDEARAIRAAADISLEIFHWPAGKVVISLPCYRIVLGTKVVSSPSGTAFWPLHKSNSETAYAGRRLD